MMRIAIIGLGLALAVALAACGSSSSEGPQRVGTTQPSVTYAYDGDKLDDATSKANDYCGKYSREAKLRELTDREGVHYATFDCH